jgi:hypothetical protein
VHQLHARTETPPGSSSPAQPRVTPERGADLLEPELGLLLDVTKEAELAFKTSTQECDMQQAYQKELTREQHFLERVKARARAKAQREEAAERKFAGVPTGVLRVKQQVHGVQGVGARPCVARERLYVPYVSGFLKYSESQSSASLKLQAVVRGHAGRKAFHAYRSREELQQKKLLTFTPRCVKSVTSMQRAVRKISLQRRKRQEMEESNAGMNDSQASYTQAQRCPRGAYVGVADINISIRTMSLGGDVRHVKLVPAAINRAFVSQLDMTEVPCLRIDAAGTCCRITPHGIEPSRASWPNEKAEHCERAELARALPYAKSLFTDAHHYSTQKLSISAAARRQKILSRAEEVEHIFAHYRLKALPVRIAASKPRRLPAGGDHGHPQRRGLRPTSSEVHILGCDKWEEDACTGALSPLQSPRPSHD